MPKKPTAEDAKIIMRLYDLRREPEMRKARAWYAGWWPRSADDVLKVFSRRNAGKRMVSPGERLLGHGGVLCDAWRLKRGPFFRLQR